MQLNCMQADIKKNIESALEAKALDSVKQLLNVVEEAANNTSLYQHIPQKEL